VKADGAGAGLPLVVENLSFRYRIRPELALMGVTFDVRAGEILLVAGSSGCGKTTLIRCVNGLIPRSYRGERGGAVRLHGREVAETPLAEVSQIVGTVLQDPERQIIGSNVLADLAFGLENLGLPAPEVMDRVRSVASRLNMGDVLDRETWSLSGGEMQKVALAGVLAMNPSILLLDEPLASLDPASAHEALAIFRGLADEGAAILLVEHRVEDALAAGPDRLLYMREGRVDYLGPADRLPAQVDHREVKLPAPWVVRRVREQGHLKPAHPPTERPVIPREPLIVFDRVSFAYGDGPRVLQGVDLTIRHGDLLALLGPNGAGKSTLVKHAIGLLKPSEGEVRVRGKSTRGLSVAENARQVGYVFQSPSHMLFAPTVREELAFGPRNLSFPKDETERSVGESVTALNLTGLEEYSPLGLSFGQQKRVTIAAVLAMRSRVLVMDEPTAGQDYANYTRFMEALCGATGESGDSFLTTHFDATVFITHDLDLAVTFANRVVMMGEGSIVADGPPEEVLGDLDLLRRYRVLPTSLLQLNLELLPRTGRFLPAEALAAYA
jgi:energy-coupling factor transport system ATP-binding protein